MKHNHTYTHPIGMGIVDLAFAWKGNLRHSFTRVKQAQERKRYFLGEKYPSVYFSMQEARCMFYFLQGLSSVKAAPLLSLLPRSVTYYCGRMRRKLGCRTKKQLIACVKQTDFMRELPEIARLEERRQKARQAMRERNSSLCVTVD